MTDANVIALGRPIWSGHCQFPCTGPGDPEQAARRSHERCQTNGGGVGNLVTGLFHPCPCPCHIPNHTDYDCGACGYVIREAPALGTDEDGDPVYVHIDGDGGIYSIECPT